MIQILRSHVKAEPYGVVIIMVPWNYPVSHGLQLTTPY